MIARYHGDYLLSRSYEACRAFLRMYMRGRNENYLLLYSYAFVAEKPKRNKRLEQISFF